MDKGPEISEKNNENVPPVKEKVAVSEAEQLRAQQESMDALTSIVGDLNNVPQDKIDKIMADPAKKSFVKKHLLKLIGGGLIIGGTVISFTGVGAYVGVPLGLLGLAFIGADSHEKIESAPAPKFMVKAADAVTRFDDKIQKIEIPFTKKNDKDKAA